MTREPDTRYASSGLFRKLSADDMHDFVKAAEEAFDPRGKTVLDPVHHPAYRARLARLALEQAEAELAVIP